VISCYEMVRRLLVPVVDCQSYILIAVVSTVSFTVDTENRGQTHLSKPTEREQFRTLNPPELFSIDILTISMITIDFKNFNPPSLSEDYIVVPLY
jgi:hypothetical protein